MLTHLYTGLTDTVLPFAAGGGFHSTALRTWIIKNIVPLLLLFVGIVIISHAQKGKMGKTFTMGGIALFGLLFIAGAALIYGFASQIATLTFG